mmetsp:Transcript_34178/g.102000  ORF Transcript_34178/g.102000 Transcript_34178/m.102000 type:complete len:387 (-) Transcript_34178:291-1451(-)
MTLAQEDADVHVQQTSPAQLHAQGVDSVQHLLSYGSKTSAPGPMETGCISAHLVAPALHRHEDPVLRHRLHSARRHAAAACSAQLRGGARPTGWLHAHGLWDHGANRQEEDTWHLGSKLCRGLRHLRSRGVRNDRAAHAGTAGVGLGCAAVLARARARAPVALGEEGRREELGDPVAGQRLVPQRLGVVHVVRRGDAPLSPAVEEGAESLPRACLPTQVPAHHSLEVVGMVELLLGAVRVGTPEAEGAALRVAGSRVLLAPVGTQASSIADGDRPPSVLIVVSVDAGVPLVLHPHGAPACLVLVHEEAVCQSRGVLVLLADVQERCADLLPGVRKRADGPAPAQPDVGEGGAESPLRAARVAQGAPPERSPPLAPAVGARRRRPVA